MLPTTISGCITCAGNNLLIRLSNPKKDTRHANQTRAGCFNLFPKWLFYELLLESFDLGICIIAFGSEVELDLRLGS